MSPFNQERVTDEADPLAAELVERQYQWRVRFRYADEGAYVVEEEHFTREH